METIKLHRLAGKWLSKKVLYLGDVPLSLSESGAVQNASSTDISTARIVVIGKRHYYEATRHFSFKKIREIKSAVMLDPGVYSPFPAARCYVRKIHQTDDGVTVNLWFVSPDAAAVLEKQFISLAIPETALLLLHSREQSQIFEVNLEGKMLLSWAGKTGAVQSIRSDSRKADDLENFRRTVGQGATDCPVVRLTDWREYAAFLFEVIGEISLNHIYPFVNINGYSIALDPRAFKWGCYSAAVFFLIYTGLSTAIPYRVGQKLEKEEQAISVEAAGLIEKQNQIEEVLRKQKILAAPINAYSSRYQLLTMFQKVLPENTKIKQLNVSDNRVEIHGETPSATALLTNLSGTEGIQNAQFISPVQKETKTGRDSFTLSFIFNGNNS